jgi:hypothetical protein
MLRVNKNILGVARSQPSLTGATTAKHLDEWGDEVEDQQNATSAINALELTSKYFAVKYG